MCQPTTLVLALTLLVVMAEARAQPSPVRERRERTVTMTGTPADRPHEIRAAKGIATVIFLDAPINRDALEVEGRGTRLKVDAGDSSIILEPLIEIGAAERLVLRVPFVDGKAPAQAVFVLVSSPSEVDTRIDVVRHEQTIEACQAELAETQARCSKINPMHFARAGWLTRKGVIAREIEKCSSSTPTAQGLVCTDGTAYLAERWALVDVMISNGSNGHLWVPSEVAIKGMTSGVSVTVRAVEIEPARISPGKVGRVLVEMEPPTNAGELFVLELRDAAGPGITIPGVNLSAQESKR